MSKFKKIQQNKGFSLIELLVSMTIVSIIMLMVVSFMSSTSAAYRKTMKGQTLQAEAEQSMVNVENMIMSSSYVRVSTVDGKYYTLDFTSSSGSSYKASEVSGVSCTGYDFVPDNYANYASGYGKSAAEDESVIVNTDFRLISDTGKVYPLDASGGATYESRGNLAGENANLMSFRALGYTYNATTKRFDKKSQYYYVKPDYIYIEYSLSDTDGPGVGADNRIGHIMYGFGVRKKEDNKPDFKQAVPSGKKLGTDYFYGIYVYRYYTYQEGSNLYVTTDPDCTGGTSITYAGYQYALSEMSNVTKDSGVLTENLTEDFYVSVDADSSSLMLNTKFGNKEGKEYYVDKSVSSRTSYVMSAKRQRLKMYVDGTIVESSNGGGTGGGSGGGTGEESGGGSGGTGETENSGGSGSE